ncbi:MAG: TonB-dependent vitamin B12 receptor [Pseudomonadota bacterium]
MRFGKTLLATLAAATACPAFAQDAKSVELAPVIVTASRVAETLDATLAPVTVITRADIERLQAASLQELLVGLPGISITNNGGAGKATSVFLRGSNSDHLIVLIDGIKIGSATLGSTSFEQIPVDLIERIEIVRGPRSSLYGSEAIGGVIQIFTKRAKAGEAITPTFAIGGGSLGSAKQELGVRGSVGTGGWYNLGASASTTDGIDVQPASSDRDRDGFRSVAGSLASGWRFANGAEVSGNWLRAHSRNEYDGFNAASNNVADSVQQVFGGKVRYAPVKPLLLTFAAGQSQDLSDNFRKPTGGALTTFDTTRYHYSLLGDYRLSERQGLSAGVDYQDDRVFSTTTYDEDSRDNLGVFAQYQGGYGGHELQLSLRHDDNQQYGQHDTGAAAYGYRFGNGIRVGVSHGTAFKAPTFNQLYFPNFGDPTLKPETSRSSEINISGSNRVSGVDANWSLNGYRTRITNLIDFVPPTFAPVNVGESQILGVEAQLAARWQTLSATTTLNWMEPENRSEGANKGKTLQRRPERTARLDLDYRFARASIGASVYGASKRYNNPSNSVAVDGYGTVDLRATVQVLPAWQLQLKAANLLDKDYQTVSGFDQAGNTYFVTVRYSPVQ